MLKIKIYITIASINFLDGKIGLNNPRYCRIISISNRISISEKNIRARFRPFHMGIGRVKSHFRGSFLWITDRNTLYDIL